MVFIEETLAAPQLTSNYTKVVFIKDSVSQNKRQKDIQESKVFQISHLDVYYDIPIGFYGVTTAQSVKDQSIDTEENQEELCLVRMSKKLLLKNLKSNKLLSEVEFADNIYLFDFDGKKNGLVMSLSRRVYKF